MVRLTGVLSVLFTMSGLAVVSGWPYNQDVVRGSIQGTIFNSDTHEPIAGAVVTVTVGEFPITGVGALTLLPPEFTGGAAMIRRIPPGAPAAAPVRSADDPDDLPSVDGGNDSAAAPVGVVLDAYQAIQAPVYTGRDGRSVTLRGSVSTTTDASGRFAFRGLDAGSYRLSAAADGYVSKEFGQRTVTGQGRPIHLLAGQELRDLDIGMLRTGSLAGRIRETDAQAISGIRVYLLQKVYTAAAELRVQQVAQASTNDGGDYRFDGIPPGEYYLIAGRAPPGIGASNPLRWTAYRWTFYPGVFDLESAHPIVVRGALEIYAPDLLIDRQPLYRIAGRVIDSRTALPPSHASIQISYRSIVGSGGLGGGAQFYNGADGAFELTGLEPGVYRIGAVVTESSPDGGSTQEIDAFTVVRLDRADIDELELRIPQTASIFGRLDVESSGRIDAASSGDLAVGEILISLHPSDVERPVEFHASAAGNFAFETSAAEFRRLTMYRLPPDFFIKKAELNGRDILAGSVGILPGTMNVLNIVVSSDAAQVDGVVLDDLFVPQSGVRVVAVPAERGRIDRYKSSITDEYGRFAIAGVAPGDYTLFAWDGLAEYGYFDPELFARFAPYGTRIQAAEGGRLNVNVSLMQ